MSSDNFHQDNWRFEFSRKIELLRLSTSFQNQSKRARLEDEGRSPDNDRSCGSNLIQSFENSAKMRRLLRAFVLKLKRNAFVGHFEDPETIKQLIEGRSLLNLEMELELGIEVSPIFSVILAALTVLLIISAQMLATFDCFFEDYRSGFLNSITNHFLKIICIIMASFKLLLGMFVKRWRRNFQIVSFEHIWQGYINSWQFFFDACLFLSVSLLLFSAVDQAVSFTAYGLSLITFLNIHANFLVIEEIVFDNEQRKQYWLAIRVFVSSLFLVHLVASILFAMTFINPNKNWLTEYVSDEDWSDRYFYGYYWAASILTFIGFGDIRVTSSQEAIIVAMLALVGPMFLSFNINHISLILTSIREANREAKMAVSTFKRLADSNNISSKLKGNILKYIKNSADLKSAFQFENRKRILSSLPENLCRDFNQEVSNSMFRGLPFLDIMSKQTKIRFSKLLKTRVFYPEEYITKKRVGLTHLIILRVGELQLAYQKQGSQKDGTVFACKIVESESNFPYLLNQYFLKMGCRINYDIIAKSYCLCFEAGFDELLAALRKHSSDNELYRQIYDSAFFSDQQWKNDDDICGLCKNQKHLLFHCPKVQYMPFRDIIFLKATKKENAPIRRNIIKYQRNRGWLRQIRTVKLWKVMFKNFTEMLSAFQCRRGPSSSAKWVESENKHLNERDLRGFVEKECVLENSEQEIMDTIREQAGDQRKLREQWKQEIEDDRQEGDINIPGWMQPQRFSNCIMEETISAMRERDEFKKQHRFDRHQLQVDSLYNFGNYFTRQNPKKLVKVSLKEVPGLLELRWLSSHDRFAMHEIVVKLLG